MVEHDTELPMSCKWNKYEQNKQTAFTLYSVVLSRFTESVQQLTAQLQGGGHFFSNPSQLEPGARRGESVGWGGHVASLAQGLYP